MVVIKRYKNRKLYDTNSKKYITLSGIARLINDGEQVTIVDNDTGEDLTALTLAQIILEQQKNHRHSLPLSFLIKLIQFNSSHLLEQLLSSDSQTIEPELWFSYEEFERALIELNLPSRKDLRQLSYQLDELDLRLSLLGDTALQNKEK